ncbi:MAG TPA: hypothetical protein VGO80_00520 [Solirubrobacteraceae bacterium]|jgi:hypothetical protein|nr:hypothetical protein [Solirubrobacteraceae bacterium]
MSRATLAYLDAGSGSIILQAILGGTAAVAVALKLWWRNALRLLHIRRDPANAPRRGRGQST